MASPGTLAGAAKNPRSRHAQVHFCGRSGFIFVCTFHGQSFDGQKLIGHNTWLSLIGANSPLLD